MCLDDGNLYFYTHQNGNYELSIYNEKKDKLEQRREMNDVGYIYAMAMYDNNFASASWNAELNTKDLTTDILSTEKLDTLIFNGTDFCVYKGNLIYINRISGNIEVLYKGKIETVSELNDVSEKEPLKQAFVGEKLVVGVATPSSLPFDKNKLRDMSGIDTSIYTYPRELNEDGINHLLIKLMAGDSDVDIYFLNSRTYSSVAVMNNKMYVPLNDSDIISEKNDKYFGYIKDFLIDDGNIWAVPMGTSTAATWYVPENIEKIGITKDDFALFSDYLKACEKAKETEDMKYYVEDWNIASHLSNVYDSNFNDFENKFVNYDTPTFRNMFSSLYDGWIRYSSPYAQNPLMNNMYMATAMGTYNDGEEFDENIMLYRTAGISSYFENHQLDDLTGWRVCAAPKLESLDEKNPINLSLAYINPNSEKIDAAKYYLEYLTYYDTELLLYDAKYYTNFFYEDATDYVGIYDTSHVLFKDIYSIYQQGVTATAAFPIEFDPHVDEYQNGRYTLDDVVNELQRQAEMGLNE